MTISLRLRSWNGSTFDFLTLMRFIVVYVVPIVQTVPLAKGQRLCLIVLSSGFSIMFCGPNDRNTETEFCTSPGKRNSESIAQNTGKIEGLWY